jgi:hypothetical protein
VRKPNAQHGDEPKGSYLHIRVTQQQKARWVKQAQARGMKLSAWVLERLERERRGKLADDLERYNHWRRGAEDIEQPNPNRIGHID